MKRILLAEIGELSVKKFESSVSLKNVVIDVTVNLCKSSSFSFKYMFCSIGRNWDN